LLTSWEAPWDEGCIQALGPALITAANAAGIGVAVVTIEPAEPRVVYVTEVGAQIIGFPRENILGKLAMGFLTPEERERHKSVVGPSTRIPADRRLTFETAVLTVDARRVPIEVSAAPVELDGQWIALAFFRDISARERSTEALRQSEERFRRLIELAPDAVWINEGERLLYVNQGTVRMLGYDSEAEVLALTPSDIIHQHDHAAMVERMQRMEESGQSLPPCEYRIRRRDGSSAVTEVHSMPIEWQGRQAILGFGRDVTARKEIETRLVRTDRLAALGTLLAGIAHEMNNPLAYVLLGIDQLCSGLDGAVRTPAELARLREILEEVRQGANRVAAVVRQLRSTSGPDTEERGAVDVGQALRAALRVAGNEIRHRARLVTALEEIPAVEGSAQRLEQVFLNLLVNAAQSLPEGRAENEIRVTLRPATGDLIAVEIADNGNGISAEVLPRIFDPFFTTKAVGVGMGLGLSICHGIVAAHGGNIDVESELGRGTRFRVLLPVRVHAGGIDVSVERAAPVVSTPRRRRRILVIDDEAALGSMIERMLTDDFDVDVVTDGRQGLERLCAGVEYHRVLCDIMMPEMNGMDLHAVTAEKRPGLERCFVFMTGGAFTPRAADFLATVRNRRLEKPFELADLRAVVDGV